MGATRKHGILSDTHLKTLIRDRAIDAEPAIIDSQVQPASVDLRLGTKAYRLISSFLPERSGISEQPHPQSPTFLDMLKLYRDEGLIMYEFDLTKGAILEKGHVYLVPLLERVALPPHVRGRANPKSSTGRLDIFTRLITDLHAGFDEIPLGYQGSLYLEIVPRSFTIRVQTGLALNQLRLLTGRPTVSDSQLRTLHRSSKLLYHNDDDLAESRPLAAQEVRVDHGLFLRIDLRGSGTDREIVGYRAKKNSHMVDLSKIGHYSALDFWEPIYRQHNNTLLLEPEAFYILASHERINVPPRYAAEMVAYEAAFGELRTHYAGFFDPGFGAGDGPRKGTQVVLEVRPHDVPFLIHDGQTFFKVVYEHMLDPPEHLYGASIGSSYHQQGLTLSKHFKW